MTDGTSDPSSDSNVSPSIPVPGRPTRRIARGGLPRIGASAQSAIPGLYAWAITVAPAAWSRSAPALAKVAAIVGLLALTTAPLIDGVGAAVLTEGDPSGRQLLTEKRRRLIDSVRAWRGPTWARVWSVWGFVLSSATVWVLVPSALSSARLDGVRGAFGMVGWALFAFASAGPALRPDPTAAERIVASTSLKPRSDVMRGDGVYAAIGIALALSMQAVGWGIAVSERAVLVRLVTVVCGIAIISGTTNIALSRHTARVPASRRVRLKRALPWGVMLVLVAVSGFVVGMAR